MIRAFLEVRNPLAGLRRPLLGAILALIVLFAALYAAAVGPYWKISPDSTVYVLGARSLAQGEGYTIQGSPIRLFPPLTSLVFSLFTRISPEDYRLLNAVVTLFALAGLFLFWRLFLTGPSTLAGPVIVLLSLASVPFFHQCTFLLSDLIFMAFSAASLLAFENLIAGKRRTWALAAGGALLGACMTRTVGVALLAAAAVRILISLAGRKGRRAEGLGRTTLLWPALAAIIPLVFVVLWSVKSGQTGYSYLDLFLQKTSYVPEAGQLSLLEQVARLAFNLKKMTRLGEIMLNGFPFGSAKIQLLAGLVGSGLFFWGLFRSLRARLSLTSFYVLFYVILVALNPADEGFRFFVPILPLCYFYAWQGLVDLGARLGRRTGSAARVAAAVGLGAFVVLNLGFGMRDILRRLPEEHRSPFGEFPMKYEANLDAQRMAMWLRENSPPDSRILCQHAAMWELISGRRGFELPFTHEQAKVLAKLERDRIGYVLVDKKKSKVKAFLLPVLRAFPSRFELVLDAGQASLYRVRDR